MNESRWMDQFAIVTVGFPFVVFKLLLGVALMKAVPSPMGIAVGYLLISLGLIDLAINGINLVSFWTRRDNVTEVCLSTVLFAVAERRSRWGRPWRGVGTAVDVALSFTLVATMVGCDWFHFLSAAQNQAWSLAVIVNVLGAGLSQLMISLREVKVRG